jgi:isoquinoline 1-oxidoreductase subunit beta
MGKVSRRRFLQSSAALGGGLVIPFYLHEGGRALAQAPQPPRVAPNAFVRIAKDGGVTVIVKHLEFGQGVATALPMLLCEELECDWTRVKYELAPAGAEYANTEFGMQMTGASSSVSNSFAQLRTAGAQARTMLMQAAADQWKVKVAEVRADKGSIVGPGGKRLAYGQLAEAAGKLPVPEKVALKDPKDFKLIGKPTRRIDSAEKVDGRAVFGIDLKRNNLHVACVARPPAFGATLNGFGAAKVQGIPGVTHVVEVSSGVAVVANHFWGASRGRAALELEWDLGPNAKLSTPDLAAKFRELAKTPGKTAKKSENPDAIKSAAKTLVAEYEVPFLAHAPMEPLNCTVEVRDAGAEIWVGSQTPAADVEAAARVLRLKPAQVKLNVVPAGGGFGRRGTPRSEAIVEACEIAAKVKIPVKVIWTREDDIKGGYYRPMYVHRVEVGLDAGGRIAAWNHTIVGPSIAAGTPMEAAMLKDGLDPASTEGASDTVYALPNMQVTLHTVNAGVPVSWWRSVGHSHTAFAMETMVDEVAAATRKDAVALRRELLASEPRHLAVLDLAASKAGWGTANPPGRARGIAIHKTHDTVCAQVAEVSLRGNDIRVHRVTAAFDCGLVVNPLTVEAQLQGAIAFGLSAALFGEITVKDGRVEQSNFNDYRVLRMNEMPQVEVHLLPGGDKPTGVGEPGVPPIAPAVANALFALTGKRARKLPLTSMKWT